jgi:hypothetical protein
MNEGGPHAFASSSLESDCSLSESKMTPPARAVNKTNNQSINQSINQSRRTPSVFNPGLACRNDKVQVTVVYVDRNGLYFRSI